MLETERELPRPGGPDAAAPCLNQTLPGGVRSSVLGYDRFEMVAAQLTLVLPEPHCLRRLPDRGGDP